MRSAATAHRTILDSDTPPPTPTHQAERLIKAVSQISPGEPPANLVSRTLERCFSTPHPAELPKAS